MHEPPSYIKALDHSQMRVCYRTRKGVRIIGTQQRNDALSQTTRVRGLKRA